VPRLDFWFRLFYHAALGLASVCLLYAEAFFLPDPLLYALYLTVGLQVLAIGADGRRWLLPAWAANLLAGAVAGGGAVWVAVQLWQPDSVLADLPLPAGLLPYIGPMLIALLVIKLFRPRTPRDFWLLQGVGALQVALACVLATNPQSGLPFGLLLAAYVACALGCLTLHYFQEEQRREKGAPLPAADRLPFAYRMAPFCLRWALAVAALAAPLFLLTPRFDGQAWDSASLASPGTRPGAPPSRVGFSQSMDLNRSGPVRLSDDEVFRVAVVAAPGRTAPVPSPDQRWRGAVLDTYRQGVWFNGESPDASAVEGWKPRRDDPPLAAGWYGLDFTVGPSAGGCFLAEPVRVVGKSARRTRVESEDPKRPGPLAVSSRGPVLPVLYHGQHEYRYRQTAYADDDPDRSPADIGLLDLAPLKGEEVPGLTEWTARLLTRLAADQAHGLTAEDLRPASEQPGAARALPVEVWERVGRALTDYLARSGEYGYTLDLRRQETSLDPVMDFLVNVKQGHCERFASALTLMLRSQGIPARVVVGFHGAAELGNGVYVVRENQAHAWVEMLAPERKDQGPSAPPNGLRPYHPPDWLTLDPTPAGDATPPPYSLWDWWQDGQRTGQQLWGGMVVNYNAEEQAGLWTTLQSPRFLNGLFRAGLVLPALAVLGILAWLGLRWRRRRARGAATVAAKPAVAVYARLLALVARRARLRPRTGQTPREFAAEVRRLLMSVPAAAALADLPDEVVDLLYRVCYGGETTAEGECAALGARLDVLAVVHFSL